jgi:hypothetical protein
LRDRKEPERERAVVRTNGYWICGVFSHPHHLNANNKDETNNANCIKKYLAYNYDHTFKYEK